MQIADFLSLLSNVSGADGTYSANCPAHADMDASLKVRVDERGIIQMECKKRCQTEKILKKLNLQLMDLFPPVTGHGELPKIKSRISSCLKPLTEFEEREAEWLIQGWIPKKQITLLSADGGVGKTSIMCHIVSSVSAGNYCFLDTGERNTEPKKVLLLTSEDSISEKLKPKLRLYGANMENIISMEQTGGNADLLRSLKIGLPGLENAIRDWRPGLVVFDPIQGFLPPKVNMSSRNEMRDCLAPLVSLGEDYGVTSLILCHTNKRKGASDRNRMSDSSDLWDIARSVMMAGYTGEDGIRYLSNEKNSYSRLQETVLFSIDDNGMIVDEGFTWKRDRDFVAEKASAYKPTRVDCKEFIVRTLEENGGSMKSKDLEDRAAMDGYSFATLRRAKDELKQQNKIVYFQTGSARKGDNIWYITLVSDTFQTLPEDIELPFGQKDR